MSAEIVKLTPLERKYAEERKERTDLKGTHEERLEAEIERQRNIYRPDTAEILLRRAAVRALIERGEW